MAALTRIQLSGSTNGRQIAASMAGVTVHTSTSATDFTELDEIHLSVQNVSASDRELTLEIGGASYPNTRKITVVAGEVPVWVIRGDLTLNNGVVITAKADVDSALIVSGYVNRIMQS